ncbi:GIY-YIG nuclease family protein [Gluconobacter roseus]|uniref:GIY-YIG domain-containing protein n=1 Tax=Gluconobacter roseus NBRC 3990 TaxID=1307950 RepID=A0A4Y3M239_9PROT|nr:GIY-YIG nuclease family protein [Gluconobacter roseus]KXV44294.1 hypothetical protein AD943_04525 [Gluconobacter roseus]GBR44528.1 hypothetical protein AA3990_0780 [Gluconobacter roseus NBRC 3990]GEB02653.1 hypothetical protein GRO01_02290 [Gluconobacter roseus NBRC 3990]GLP93112.1 hypothetical protein GCM10007871_10900 [Gluconobacter roseus NBRC 3990]
MNAHPQTIQIFLPSGDPQGIRTASITTRIVQVVEIPRLRLEEFLKRPEANSVGIYILFGENDETERPKAYVGQTGNFGNRLKQHNEKKGLWWNRAVVAFSLTQSLTVTHAHYLEWLALSHAAQAQRFEMDNGTGGTRPHTLPALEAECREVFETIDILLTTLGYPIFEPLIRNRNPVAVTQTTEPVLDSQKQSIPTEFYCHASGVDGRAQYTQEGLVVLAGSYGRAEVSSSFNYAQKRQAMLEQGLLRIEGDRIYFTRDVLFKAPSPAATALLGHSVNGWTKWKDSTGKTLEEAMNRSTPGNDYEA